MLQQQFGLIFGLGDASAMRRRCVGCPAAVPRLSRGCPAGSAAMRGRPAAMPPEGPRCVGDASAVPRLSRGCPAAVPRRSRRSPGLYSCLRRCLPCRIQEQYAACRSGPRYRHHPYSSEPAGLLRPYHYRQHHHGFHCHPHTELPGPRRPRRCVHASLSKTN